LENWTATLRLPHLIHYGVEKKDMRHIVANSRGSSMKTNPVTLENDEITAVISSRL
jgi:hypothetical protein